MKYYLLPLNCASSSVLLPFLSPSSLISGLFVSKNVVTETMMKACLQVVLSWKMVHLNCFMPEFRFLSALLSLSSFPPDSSFFLPEIYLFPILLPWKFFTFFSHFFFLFPFLSFSFFLFCNKALFFLLSMTTTTTSSIFSFFLESKFLSLYF